jgi:hypothetical protein
MHKSEQKDIRPICPHCEARIEKLIKIKDGWLADHQVFCCPRCEKILQITWRVP